MHLPPEKQKLRRKRRKAVDSGFSTKLKGLPRRMQQGNPFYQVSRFSKRIFGKCQRNLVAARRINTINGMAASMAATVSWR